MQIKIPFFVRGVFFALLLILHTIFWCTPLYFVFFLKCILKNQRWKARLAQILIQIGEAWIRTNNLLMSLILNVKWDFPTKWSCQPHESYFIICNHQSWTDIFVLQKFFLQKIPFIRFFVKKELLWLPILNMAWFAFDFPIMHRHSKETLERYPHLREKDLNATRRSCERFKHTPVSILNFLEGTRFTKVKHIQQRSPFQHLLKPKTGGFAYAVNVMDKKITHLLDVTIAYPQKNFTFWDFISGKIKKVTLKLEAYEIPTTLLSGDYLKDETYRNQLKNWIEHIWNKKDRLLQKI